MRPLYGYILGRFQPIHIGHMEYVRAAYERCDRLVVGVTSPDPDDHVYSSEDPKRSSTAANPFTYWERFLMLSSSLRGDGLDAFDIVPSPVKQPERLLSYMPPPRDTVCFLTIYDDWGRAKERLLAQLGYHTEVLWIRDMATRVASGTEVRDRLIHGDEWEHLVPSGAVPHLRRYQDRIRTRQSSASGSSA